MRKNFPDWAIYLPGAIIIILLGIYVTSGISTFMDIQFSDETKYMTGGMNFFDKVPKGWGPSYSAWYRLLYFVEKDPIALHYLNFKVLAIGLSVLLFFMMYRLKVPMLVAFAGGVFFLFADLNIYSWPRISHFAANAILIALIIATYIKSNYLKLLLFMMTALGISYARPEIGMSFMVLLLSTGIYVLYKRFRLSKLEYGITAALIPVVLVLFLKMGIPMISSKGQANMADGNYPRAITAYGQHFYLNYSEWNHLEEQILFNWDILFKEYYDVHPSLMKTLMTNIPITIKHVSVNVWNYVRKSFDYVSGVFLPDKILYFPIWLKLGIFIIILALIIYGSGWAAYKNRIHHHLKEFGIGYLLVFALSFPPIISSVLIYPREHYIMLQIPLLFSMLIPLLLIHLRSEQQPELPGRSTILGMVSLGIILIFIAPSVEKMDHFNLWQEREGPVNLSAVNKLNEIGIEQPYTIIVNEGNIDPYLDNPDVYSLVGYPQLGGIPFDQAIDSFNIRVVYVTSLLEDDPFFQADKTWADFFSNPSGFNFKRVDLATPYSYLLIDNELINNELN